MDLKRNSDSHESRYCAESKKYNKANRSSTIPKTACVLLQISARLPACVHLCGEVFAKTGTEKLHGIIAL